MRVKQKLSERTSSKPSIFTNPKRCPSQSVAKRSLRFWLSDSPNASPVRYTFIACRAAAPLYNERAKWSCESNSIQTRVVREFALAEPYDHTKGLVLTEHDRVGAICFRPQLLRLKKCVCAREVTGRKRY